MHVFCVQQLVKYSLEKKVTEQGRQLQLQSTSRGGYLSQMNDLDQKLSEVLNHADVISEQMEKVETNGSNIFCTQRRSSNVTKTF